MSKFAVYDPSAARSPLDRVVVRLATPAAAAIAGLLAAREGLDLDETTGFVTRELADIAATGASGRQLWVANQASIALHAGLGFAEVSRDIALPGMSFTGGVGVCFACPARAAGSPSQPA
ncbi:MAG: hypothetical protein H6733_05225 [Alphaproteobacteria bacterium]|nr:hypothetical protein [Alphaproteobacteria bacterium]